MIFKLFKNFTITIVFAIGVTGCSDLFNDPQNTTVSPKRFGKVYRSNSTKYSRRGTDLAARTLVGSATPSFSFFGLSAGSSGNLWDRMRADFQFASYEDHAPVQAQINWFIKNQEYLYRSINRAVPYMYYIFQQVQQRHLPAEIVLLPVIESAYNPFVRSSAGALGLWQLMPGTARGFGVRQNFWFDGRRDIYASTNAALDYLTYLHSYFGGDWLLAMAAYDTGEGNVQNAIRRNAVRDRSTAFWSLPLAMETRSYVPRMLALAAIIKNPAKYGIVLPAISDKPYLEQVELGAPIKLNQAAQLADMSLMELKRLNPGYSRNTTDPTGPHKLTLPVDKIALFKERLAGERPEMATQLAQNDHVDDENPNASPIATVQANEVDDTPDLTKKIHTIKRGDTLGGIAKRYGVSVGDLKRWNKTKTRHALKLGSKLVIWNEVTEKQPVAKSKLVRANRRDSAKAEQMRAALADQHVPKQKQKSAKAKAKNTGMTARYTVRSGDSLVKIASKFGVSATDLKHMNNLKSNALKPGQQLVVKG